MKPAALLSAAALTVLLAACGGADPTTAVGSDPAVDPFATAQPAPDPADTPDGAPAASTPAVEDEGPGTDVVPSAPAVEDEGPGTDVVPGGDGDVAPVYGTATPTTYRVTGVAADDALQVRADPDPGAAAVGALPHDAIDINSTGAVATAGDQQWVEVEVPGGTVGWVNARFVTVQTPTG